MYAIATARAGLSCNGFKLLGGNSPSNGAAKDHSRLNWSHDIEILLLGSVEQSYTHSCCHSNSWPKRIHALTFASGMLCSMEWSSGSHTALVITFAAKGNGDGKQPWRHPSCHPCLQLLVEMDPKGRKPLEKSAIDIGKGKVDDGVVF